MRERFVALAPGSIWGSKRWPYYRELAERLAGGVGVLVVGGPEDAALAAGITEAVARAGGQGGGGGGRVGVREGGAAVRRGGGLVAHGRAAPPFAEGAGHP